MSSEKLLVDARIRDVLDPLPIAFTPREGLRAAAVLIPLLTKDGADHLLMTRRRHDLLHHPGQISFPGGGREGDEDPVQCALRESTEEIGLVPESVVLLGSLPPRVSVAGFWVHVVVGRVTTDDDLHPDPREVASLRAWPLRMLRDAVHWELRRPHAHADRPEMPHLDFEGETLWGLTARFTLDLCERIDRIC